MVCRQGAKQIVIRIFLAGTGVVRMARAALFRVAPNDPVVFAMVGGVLGVRRSWRASSRRPGHTGRSAGSVADRLIPAVEILGAQPLRYSGIALGTVFNHERRIRRPPADAGERRGTQLAPRLSESYSHNESCFLMGTASVSSCPTEVVPLFTRLW
jgi:hypothetical protein